MFFFELVVIDERIENGLKIGKINNIIVGNQPRVKKPQGSFPKKKEGEANIVTTRQYQMSMALVP